MEKTKVMALMVFKKVSEGAEIIGRFEAEVGEHLYQIDEAVKTFLNESNVFGEKVTQTGVKVINENDFYFDSMRRIGSVEHRISKGNMLESTYGTFYDKDDTIRWQDPVAFEGESEASDIYIGYRAFFDGIVIRSGKKGVMLFTQCEHEACFEKITSKHFKCTSNAKDAKVFKSYKEVLKYLKSKEAIFRYMVGHSGYSFSIDFPQERAEKYADVPEELASLLSSINEEGEKSSFPEPPEKDDVTEDAILQEAIRRMKRLNLWNIKIQEFARSRRICKSELGGVIYDLEDDADGMRAVEKIREMGNTPYHVIKNQLEFGPEYDVLFVSREPECWDSERPNRDGRLCVASYIPEYDSFDFGDIIVTGIGGGLKRTA